MTREELWLAAIAGLDGVNPPDYPVWHYEDMLAAIYDAVVGADSPRPFPARSWHLDELLYAVYCMAAGLDDPGCPEPTDRIELFWKGIYDGVKGEAGASVPTPVWRIEEFLSAVFTASAGWGERTLTGPIVSFIGRANTEILSLTASITPVQSFNGYDHPWPGGGGKNLIPDGTDTNNGYVASSYLKSDGSIGTVNGINVSEYFPVLPSTVYGWKKYENQAAVSASVCFYDSAKSFISGEAYNGRTDFTITSPANAAFCRVSILTVTPKTTLFMVGDDYPETWEPYSNNCPITGRTGANVYRTGKNLCYQPFPEYVNYNGTTWKNNEDGSVEVTGLPTADAYCIVTFNLPAGTYKVSGAPNDSAQGYNDILVQYPAGTTIARDYNGATESIRTFTLSSNSEGVRVLLRAKANRATGVTFYPMITLASETSAAYEPYARDAYSVDWTSVAGTVYAGSYEAVSGKLKARPQYASYNGETLVGPWLSSMDAYTPGGTPTTGAQVVDLGGTETEYTLTPQTVTALVGQNNVWADTGDVTVTVKGAGVA